MSGLVTAIREYAATHDGWASMADWTDAEIGQALAGGGPGGVRPVASVGGAVYRMADELGVAQGALPLGT